MQLQDSRRGGLLLVRAGSGVGDPGRVQDTERFLQTFHAPVQDVVVCQAAAVDFCG